MAGLFDSLGDGDAVMVGARMEELRRKQGKSREDVGELVGVSARVLGYWENGEREPRLRHFIRWVRALDGDFGGVLRDCGLNSAFQRPIPETISDTEQQKRRQEQARWRLEQQRDDEWRDRGTKPSPLKGRGRQASNDREIVANYPLPREEPRVRRWDDLDIEQVARLGIQNVESWLDREGKIHYRMKLRGYPFRGF